MKRSHYELQQLERRRGLWRLTGLIVVFGLIGIILWQQVIVARPDLIATATPTVTLSVTPSPTVTSSPTVTASPSTMPTNTIMPSRTAQPSATLTRTATTSITPSSTPRPRQVTRHTRQRPTPVAQDDILAQLRQALAERAATMPQACLAWYPNGYRWQSVASNWQQHLSETYPRLGARFEIVTYGEFCQTFGGDWRYAPQTRTDVTVTVELPTFLNSVVMGQNLEPIVALILEQAAQLPPLTTINFSLTETNTEQRLGYGVFYETLRQAYTEDGARNLALWQVISAPQ